MGQNVGSRQWRFNRRTRSAWRIPAAGFPVISRTTSIPALAIIAAESAVMAVLPALIPSSTESPLVVSYFSGGNPVLSSAANALSGDKSAIAASRSPLVRCAWEILGLQLSQLVDGPLGFQLQH